MNLNEYLMAFRDSDGFGPADAHGYKSHFPLAPRIKCADGFSLSVQATKGAYCSPRENIAHWYRVEVGYPSAPPALIMDYAEEPNQPTETVYAFVPIELVEQLIELHGGPDAEAVAEAMRSKHAEE